MRHHAAHLRVSPYVMRVAANQVAQAVRHERGAQVHFHHVVHIAAQQPHGRQALQLDAFGQAVHLHPAHACNTPRKDVHDVTSAGQRASPWQRNSVKVEMDCYVECKLRFSCAQFRLWQMHWTNLLVCIEAEFLCQVLTFEALIKQGWESLLQHAIKRNLGFSNSLEVWKSRRAYASGRGRMRVCD